MTHATPANDRKHSGRRFGAIAVIAVLLLGACTSDPDARRVALDIIEAQALEDPALDEECMLDVLDDTTDDELEEIARQVDNSNAETQAAGQAALDEFESALAACN